MFKVDMEYHMDCLYVTLSGFTKKRHIEKLKKRLYAVIEEYGIDQIVIDIQSVLHLDYDAFYEFLDDYDASFEGNLKVIEPAFSSL